VNDYFAWSAQDNPEWIFFPVTSSGLIDVNLEIRSPGADDALISCHG
jgi:hypothetical protein